VSGPLSTVDAPPVAVDEGATAQCVEVTPSREVTVGDLPVRRALPRRGRRTVGAWCFADHMGPASVSEEKGVDIGPHPHSGLHTVTWLVAGEVLHRDSLGSEQVIRPGQLNLMTAGAGVTHSEEATGSYSGDLHGIQLWVAQPEATRHGLPAFEHHGELPEADLPGAVATVLVGDFAGSFSSARRDTPLVAVDAQLHGGLSEWPLWRDFEYAVVVLEGAVSVGEQVVRPGSLAYLGLGRDALPLRAEEPSRALLIGGAPFAEPIVMWWNFVARSREEVELASRQWAAADDRFGRVASPLARIAVPPRPWPAGS
jgi:hypothetical protein